METDANNKIAKLRKYKNALLEVARLHFGECAAELHNLIPPSPFHHRTTRRTATRHPFMVDISSIRSKRFDLTFIIRAAKEWNTLPASLFPDKYNLELFKSRVNTYLLDKMFSCTMFIIVSRLIFSGFSYDQTLPALRWVDHVDPDIMDMDIFFDRLVVFVHDVLDEDSYLGDHTFLAPGVFIKNDTVLTSFNPFRKLTYSQEELSKVSVVYLKYRTIKRWHINVTYILEFTQINCARQIILDEIENSWHMPEKEPMIHSSVHDLMVVRIGEAVTFMDTRLYDPLSFDRYKEDNKYSHEAGPIMTGIATPADILGSSVKFASLGFKNDLHIWSSCYLRSAQFDFDDNVIENCDEWIPKDWGHFICIRNVDNKFKGVGSGAMLFHDDLLFGVGSFLLSKHSLSVLVFTDVRPYYELMFETCTVRDQSLLSFAEA